MEPIYENAIRQKYGRIPPGSDPFTGRVYGSGVVPEGSSELLYKQQLGERPQFGIKPLEGPTSISEQTPRPEESRAVTFARNLNIEGLKGEIKNLLFSYGPNHPEIKNAMEVLSQTNPAAYNEISSFISSLFSSRENTQKIMDANVRMASRAYPSSGETSRRPMPPAWR
jgi:hypothetical protein